MGEPLGFAGLTSSRWLNFMERAPGVNSFIATSPGAMFFDWTENERLTWAIGIFHPTDNNFGFGVGDGELAGVTDGDRTRDARAGPVLDRGDRDRDSERHRTVALDHVVAELAEDHVVAGAARHGVVAEAAIGVVRRLVEQGDDRDVTFLMLGRERSRSP